MEVGAGYLLNHELHYGMLWPGEKAYWTVWSGLQRISFAFLPHPATVIGAVRATGNRRGGQTLAGLDEPKHRDEFPHFGSAVGSLEQSGESSAPLQRDTCIFQDIEKAVSDHLDITKSNPGHLVITAFGKLGQGRERASNDVIGAFDCD